MSYKCSVIACKSKYLPSRSHNDKITNNGISFFVFPSESHLKQEWLNRIGRPYFTPAKSSRICSNHFAAKFLVTKDNKVILKTGAVPSTTVHTEMDAPRLTVHSSKSSEENVLLNRRRRRVNSLPVSEVSEIGIRQRRNTVFVGTYDFGLRKKGVAPSDSNQTKSVTKKVISSDSIGKSKVVTPTVSKHQPKVVASTDLNGNSKTATPIVPTHRSKIVASTNSTGKSKQVNSVSVSEVSEIGIRQRRNTVFVGTYDFGSRKRGAVSSDSNQTKSVTKKITSTDSAGNSNIVTPIVSTHRPKVVASTNSTGKRKQIKPVAMSEVPEIGIKRRRESTRQPKIVTPPKAVASKDFKGQSKMVTPHTVQTKANQSKIIPSTLNGHTTMVVASRKSSKKMKKMSTIVPSNQLSIEQFLAKKQTSPNRDDHAEPEVSSKEDCIFGWTVISSQAVPFIVKDSEKYCALRMIESTAVNKYIKSKLKIGTCSENVECFPPNQKQCDLLNEINYLHCNTIFGKSIFSSKDLLIRLSDANKYFTFVDLCHRSQMNGLRIQSEGLGFGFTLVDDKSYIPYEIVTEQKFIPLRYLHCNGEIFEFLKSKSRVISGEDALFLKLCCKFDGTGDVGDRIEVIDLMAIECLAPPKTTFEDFWPKTTSANYQVIVIRTVKGIRLEYVERKSGW